jgi:hypothetical protein
LRGIFKVSTLSLKEQESYMKTPSEISSMRFKLVYFIFMSPTPALPKYDSKILDAHTKVPCRFGEDATEWQVELE